MKHDASSSRLTDQLAALSEPLRLRLCRILESHELSVGEISRVVQLPQSTVSRNLKVLADAGWLAKRAEGTATMYRLLLDDLPPSGRALWVTVRQQLETDADAAQAEDSRRIQTVLAERTTDSVSFFGRVAGSWDSVRAELFGTSFTAWALLSLLPRDWTVADIGCGTGNGAELVAPHVKQVIAVDQSGPMLDAARKRLERFANVRFADGPVEALPLEDSSVDAAMGLLILHHVREVDDALSEMFRVVRPGGKVLVIDMVEHDRSVYRNTMGHVHLGFNLKRFAETLEKAGFTRPRVTPIPGEAEAKGPGLFVAVAEKT
jgi:ubiquinone/menaquinone biosynthesis C-methylase UbiE/DNA-binding transcriptional ArsR family regulator